MAGGCLALGLRFAGSQSAAAADVIRGQLRYFLACKGFVPDAGVLSCLPAIRNMPDSQHACLAFATNSVHLGKILSTISMHASDIACVQT